MMQYTRKFYGKTIIDGSDSVELQNEDKIELEYYQVENKMTCKPYGIEVVKRDTQDGILKIETKKLDNICERQEDTSMILDILMNNKVTPISVDDVIDDLTKIKVI